MVDTPLYINGLSRSVCCYRRVAPVVGGLIVVDTDSGIVATWTAAAYSGSGDIWPGFDGLSNCALGAGVYAGLYTVCKQARTGVWTLLILQNQAGCGWMVLLSIHVQRRT